MKILLLRNDIFSTGIRKLGSVLAVVLAMGLLLGAIPAQAAVVLTAVETADREVYISGGGTLNLDAWGTVSEDEAITASVAPATGGVIVGGTGGGDLFFVAQYTNPSGFAGPENFGDGTEQIAVQARGDDFPFGIRASGPSLFVDPSYFGGPLVGEATYSDTTFEELGMEVGTYVWTWGSGETADSMTLLIEDGGDPPPPTAGSLFKKVSCPAQDVIILPPGERTEIDDIIVSANQDQIFKLKLSPLDFIITQLSMKAQEPVVINFSGIVESLEEGSLEEQSIQLDCSGNGNLFITLVGSKTGM